MKALEIKPNVYSLAVVDWNNRDFHGYSLSPRGTTYNAYLVKDEKVTLFDTVKEDHLDELLQGIAQVQPDLKIDYLVANHLEPDHSGAMVKIVELCRPERIFVSKMGEASARAHYPEAAGWPLTAVANGETLSLGSRTVKFLETRMLHWPDNMFSYLVEDRLLISSDAFGQNIASSERFADQVDRSILDYAAKEYYANIVNPYAPMVQKTLAAVAEAGLTVDMICPDHGLMWRGEDAGYALAMYGRFAEQKPTAKAVIFYDTMWRSTEKMALAAAQGVEEAGLSARVMWLKANHHSQVQTEIFDAGAVLVGSPTHNNGILPEVLKMLGYMKGLKPRNKVGGAFGSFGWSGEAVKIITEWLQSMEIELPSQPVKWKHTAGGEDFEQCRELGRTVGRTVMARLG